MSHEIEAAFIGLLNKNESLGNAKARELLGLDEAAYESLKSELLAKGLIATGRGRGGSIRLAGLTTGLARLQRGPVQKAGLEPGDPGKKKKATLERGEPGKKNGSAFEQAFRNIDDALWKDPGCTSELDYTEQTSWILFLKYLEDLEEAKQMAAELEGRKYTPIIEAKGFQQWLYGGVAN